MTEAREISLSVPDQGLKKASAALIRAFGGQVAVGETFGRAQSRYSDAGSRSTGVFLTVREVAELEDQTAGAAGHPIVTRTLAKRQGFELVSLPDALPAAGDLLQLAAKVAKEGGDVISGIGAALADGAFCGRDAAAIVGEADQLIHAAVTLRAIALARLEGDI
ncbi:phage regulatory CII family protein [Sphingomonas sp. MS122]|uniref:phage regulatory CII family protein n=1 Tax=Sphingomonas sp. MS122 TaxID=3412683 RepID=UPI003C2C5060